MRRPISYLLLCILVTQMGGALIIFKIRQVQLQYQMYIRLQELFTTYELFKLSYNEYKACIIEENELYYNDKLYDIKNIKTSGDTVLISAIHDYKEQYLISQLKSFLGITNDHSVLFPSKLIKLTSMHYIPQNTCFRNCILCSSSIVRLNKRIALISRITDVASPPPETLF